MSNLVGTGKLIGFILKRDRRRLVIWVLVLGLLPIATANAFFELTPTEADRERMAATAIANPAFQAILGPIHGTSIGALTAWRVGTIGAVLVALMAILTVIRHTREEEESGRAELLGSTVLGRHALAVAAVTVVSVAGLGLALVITAGLTGLGLPLAGSIVLGLGYGMVAVSFAAVAVLAAQLTEGAGAARGIAVGALGVAFLLRAVGDATDLSIFSWLSPIGWFSQLRAFAGEAAWVFALYIGLAILAAGAALALASSRDLGAGVLPPRKGPATAAPWLRSPLALAARLQRGALVGWAAGVATIAVVYGSIANSVGDLLVDNPQLAEIFEMLGGERGIVDAFFGAAMGIFAVITAAYATRTVLRLRVEEETQRADPILATTTSRPRWMVSHLFFAFFGSMAILLLAGLVAGSIYGAVVGDLGDNVLRVLGAALVQVPAVWVMAALAAALYGFSPRLTQASWGALVVFLLFGQLGQILQLPQWMLNLSPFSHVPAFPVESLNATPLILLLGVAGALLAAGITGFQRRDLA